MNWNEKIAFLLLLVMIGCSGNQENNSSNAPNSNNANRGAQVNVYKGFPGDANVNNLLVTNNVNLPNGVPTDRGVQGSVIKMGNRPAGSASSTNVDRFNRNTADRFNRNTMINVDYGDMGSSAAANNRSRPININRSNMSVNTNR